MTIPNRQFVKLQFPASGESYEFLQGLFGKVSLLEIDNKPNSLRLEGNVTSLRADHRVIETEFMVNEANRIFAKSAWLYDATWSQRYDPYYLSLAADWHDDRGECDIAQQFRNEAERLKNAA